MDFRRKQERFLAWPACEYKMKFIILHFILEIRFCWINYRFIRNEKSKYNMAHQTWILTEQPVAHHFYKNSLQRRKWEEIKNAVRKRSCFHSISNMGDAARQKLQWRLQNYVHKARKIKICFMWVLHSVTVWYVLEKSSILITWPMKEVYGTEDKGLKTWCQLIKLSEVADT